MRAPSFSLSAGVLHLTVVFVLLLLSVVSTAMPIEDLQFDNTTALATLAERDSPTLAYFWADTQCKALVGVLNTDDYVEHRGPTGCFTTPPGIQYGSVTLVALGTFYWGNKCEHPVDKPVKGRCNAFKNNKPISGVKFKV